MRSGLFLGAAAGQEPLRVLRFAGEGRCGERPRASRLHVGAGHVEEGPKVFL